MSINNGICDFCGSQSDDDGVKVIIRTDSGNQLLWDGLCREGSAFYFKHLDTEDIVDLVNRSDELMEEDPISDDDNYETRTRKLWIEDDAWYGRQEIMFRVVEAADDL